MSGPAYRIETARLVLRCWRPQDAPALEHAVTESLAHLRPWMRFVQSEPEPLSSKVARLRRLRADFDSDRDYAYGVFPRLGRTVWGGCSLHPRGGPDVRELGYWLHVKRVGRGLGREVAAALTKVAFEVDEVRRVEIQVDPRNVASAAIPKALGFTLEATLSQERLDVEGKLGDVLVFGMEREAFATSPVSRTRVRAFDAAGKRI